MENDPIELMKDMIKNYNGSGTEPSADEQHAYWDAWCTAAEGNGLNEDTMLLLCSGIPFHIETALSEYIHKQEDPAAVVQKIIDKSGEQKDDLAIVLAELLNIAICDNSPTDRTYLGKLMHALHEMRHEPPEEPTEAHRKQDTLYCTAWLTIAAEMNDLHDPLTLDGLREGVLFGIGDAFLDFFQGKDEPASEFIKIRKDAKNKKLWTPVYFELVRGALQAGNNLSKTILKLLIQQKGNWYSAKDKSRTTLKSIYISLVCKLDNHSALPSPKDLDISSPQAAETSQQWLTMLDSAVEKLNIKGFEDKEAAVKQWLKTWTEQDPKNEPESSPDHAHAEMPKHNSNSASEAPKNRKGKKADKSRSARTPSAASEKSSEAQEDNLSQQDADKKLKDAEKKITELKEESEKKFEELKANGKARIDALNLELQEVRHKYEQAKERIQELEGDIEQQRQTYEILLSASKNDQEALRKRVAKELNFYIQEYEEARTVEMSIELGDVLLDQIGDIFRILKDQGILDN